MKPNRIVTLAVVMILVGGLLAAQAQEHPAKTEHPSKADHPAKEGDLISCASGAGEFTTFLTAIETAGLMDEFHSEGPFTVFAPTDEAFAKLPDGTLEDLLKPANKARLAGLLANHVVPGKIMAADIKKMKATNLSGQDLNLKIDDGVVCVNNARVVQADLAATNGVIHGIDSVLVPAPTEGKAESEKPKDHPAH
jgi:uncharacterized surface protein with fasciclin (FAS1) repeats